MLKQRICMCLLFLSQIYAQDSENKSCRKTPKLNYLSDYTNLYQNMRMCFRVANSKGITDSDGRIYLSYRAPLNKGEDPNELCKCMKAYIQQGDWWIGAKHLCYVECDTVTLLLIGTPEKSFINAEPVYKGKDPIDGIIEYFKIYSNTQVWDDKCSAVVVLSEDERKNIVWTCKYSGSNLPPLDVLCTYIYSYVNGGDGNDILGDTATRYCSVQNGKFYLSILANEGKPQKKT